MLQHLVRGLFLTLVLPIVLSAQSFTVSGLVNDIQNKSPLIGAAVVLLPGGDLSHQIGANADVNGEFSFKDVKPGKYILKVVYLGYKPYEKALDIHENIANINISLLADVQALKEVKIEGEQTRVTLKNDTAEYTAKAYKVHPDANVEDLVTKMPAITIENGTVKAQGEDVKRVLVDGQEFFGDDATLTLRNLPAEIVDKVQVFDRLSDQAQFTGFNDGNTEKTMNITTRNGKGSSQFGKLYAGYGTDKRYWTGGNLNFFNGQQRVSLIGLSNNINQQNFSSQDLLGLSQTNNRGANGGGSGAGGGRRGGGGNGNTGGGNNGAANNFLVGQQNGINTTNSIGLNYTNRWGSKLKVSSSYFFNNTNNSNNATLDRKYFLNGQTSQLYHEDDQINNKNNNHRFNLRLEYQLDSANSFINTTRYSIQENNAYSLVSAATNTTSGLRLNSSVNDYSSYSSGYSFSNNLLWRHNFSKKGRTFSASLSTDLSNRKGNSNLYSNSDNFVNGVDSAFVTDQRTNSHSYTHNYSTNLTYTEPVGKYSQLQFSYLPSLGLSYSEKLTNRIDSISNEYTILNPSLSNKFDNTIITQRAGFGFRRKKDKYNLSANIDAQIINMHSEKIYPQAISVDRNFYVPLPRIVYQYAFSPRTNLRLIYNTNVQTPTITQLQNVIDNSNPLQLSIGNPYLNQQYTNTISGRFSTLDSTKTRPVFVFLNISKSNSYIGNSTTIAQKDTVLPEGIKLIQGAQLTRPVRLSGYSNIRLFATYGFPVSVLKSNLNINAGLTYTKTPALINEQLNTSKTTAYSTGMVLGSNISENIDFKLSYTANYTVVKNSIQSQSNNNYYTGITGIKVNLIPTTRIVFNTELNHNYYAGLNSAYNQSIWLWNAAVAFKFLKRNAGELRLSVFDILKQNTSIARNVTETYVEDRITQVLQQYYMLTFTYNFRNFKMAN